MAYADFPCPQCGGRVYDNRIGKKNPRSPDYRCSNRDVCQFAKWDTQRSAAPAPSNGNGTTHAAPTTGATNGATTRALGPLYNDCLEFAKKACVHHFGDLAAPADVIAGAATLFIQAVRDGAPIRTPAKPAVAPPPPPPPPPVPAYDPYADDRSLPF